MSTEGSLLLPYRALKRLASDDRERSKDLFWKTLRALPSHPRSVLLLDGCGALLSVLALVGVVIPFQPHFGLPSSLLWTFASVATGLAAYSLSCSQLLRDGFRPYLAGIACANSAYCLATISALLWHREAVTALAVIYFSLEAAIIAALVALEVETIRRL